MCKSSRCSRPREDGSELCLCCRNARAAALEEAAQVAHCIDDGQECTDPLCEGMRLAERIRALISASAPS
jgi:hypothetical protein